MNNKLSAIRLLLEGQNIIMDPLKALFWEDQRVLVISDVHLGKAGHFRKAGVPIPHSVHKHDFRNLDALVDRYAPHSVIFLGDLFHSDYNEEWVDFKYWVQDSHIPITLILGNHDILDDQYYQLAGLTLKQELIIPPFHFTHEEVRSDYYNISGHIHPGFRILGKGRQKVTLPCFHFKKQSAVLPAFGNFTGYVQVSVRDGHRVFVVAEGHVICVVV